jgi:hypothetical protein
MIGKLGAGSKRHIGKYSFVNRANSGINYLKML